VPELKANGTKFNYFSYANYGLDLIGPAITVNKSTLQQKPAMVKAFVEATAKGFEYTYANPAQAATIVHETWPTTLTKYDVAVTKALQPYSQTAATKGKNIGWMSPADWQQTVKRAGQAQGGSRFAGSGVGVHERGPADRLIGAG
jgi:ABC-type nitrate/sulfonate/bicarbonate transport system substrate-binding protein